MRIPRASHLLQDAIDSLDLRLREAEGNVPKAWSLLTSYELDFVREEIGNVLTSRSYYLQNYHVILPNTGQPTCIYPFLYSQSKVDEIMEDHRTRQKWSKLAVLKYRQAGMTEYATGVMCHETFFKQGAYTIVVAQNPAVSGHIQRKINYAYDHLPWWMRVERQYHNKGEYLEFNRKDEVRRQADPGMASVFLTTHAMAEGGVAVGRTTSNLLLTELCWWGDSRIYTSDIEPTMHADDTNAIAESTGLTQSGVWYNWVNDLLDNPDENDFTLVFIPPYHVKKFSLPPKPGFKLDKQESAIKQRVEQEERFSIPDEFFAWRRFRLRAAIKRDGHPYAFYSAYPLTPREAFQSSSLGVFPRNKLDDQDQANVRLPRWHGEITFQGLQVAPRLDVEELYDKDGNLFPGIGVLPRREKFNRLWMWEQPRSDAAYYLAADSSAGIEGADFACAQIFRAGQGSSPDVQCAEWHGWIQPTEFAKVIYALANYYNRCEVAIEFAKEGMVVGAILVRELQYENIYRKRRDDMIGSGLTNALHWDTNYKTKRQIISCMKEALLLDLVVIRSSLLVGQLYKYIAKGLDDNDVPTSFGGDGSPDDAAMAAMICLFGLRQSMPELRAYTEGDAQEQAGSNTRSAKPSGGSIIYGLYDEWTRMRGQTRNLAQAQDAIKKNPGWVIKPIQVSRANTSYSPIYHGRGPENDLYRQGADSWEILPSAIQAYQGARSAQLDEQRGLSGGSAVDEWNSMASGDMWDYKE